MSEKEDKAKKLKEIQERLAEIQGKSDDKATPEQKQVQKKEAKKDADSGSASASPKSKPNPTKVQQNIPTPSPRKAETKPTKKPEETIKSPSMTQEEKNWRANKVISKTESVKTEKVKEVKKPKAEKKKGSKKNKLSLVYTIVSLLITLSIVAYLVNSYFLNSDSEEIVTSKLPEEIAPAETHEENTIEQEEVFKEAETIVEDEFIAVEEENEAPEIIEEEVKEEAIMEAPPESTRRRAKAQSSSISASIPGGIIISYASNSTKDMAVNNVNTLKNKGFKAGYYYMPDKDAGSPELYKVYVGPYNDESAAMPDFKKVVDLNPKAFILRMN